MNFAISQLQQEKIRLEAELRKLKEEHEVLRKSEARYRQVVENSPISISFLSASGEHIEANAAFTKQMGFTAEDSQRVGFNLFSDPELEENGTRPYMLRALAGETVIEPAGQLYDATKTYGEKAAETYIPGQGHYFPIWNEAGEVEEIVEITTNITDLLETQQQVLEEKERAAENRNRLLSTVARVANLLLRTSDYTTVLADVVRLLGEAVNSDRCAITQEFFDSKSNKHAVKLLIEWCCAEISSVLIGSPEFGEGVVIENPASFHFQLLQGETVNFVVSELPELDWRKFFETHNNTSMLLVPILVEGVCWGHIGFDNCGEPRLFDEGEIAILQVAAESIAAAISRQARDEELRESERRYRTLFELSNEGIYRFEFISPFSTSLPVEEQVEWGYNNFRYAEVNNVMLQQYGMSKPQEIIGKGFDDLYPEDSELNRASNRAIVENGYQVRNVETEEIGADGKPRYFIANVICDVRDDYVCGGWATQTDITELKLAQQALLKAERERARELERFNTELQQALDLLQARDNILAATTEASNLLLTGEDFDLAVDRALEIIGQSLNTDRVNIHENFASSSESSFLSWRTLYEWNSESTPSQIDDLASSQGSYEDIAWLYELFQQGQSASYQIEDAPEPFRSSQAAIGVRSTYLVPIYVKDSWWGVLGLDDCREATHRSAADLSVLKTAATCIGGAIEQERTRRAKEEAEQNILREREQAAQQRAIALAEHNRVLEKRDRILSATAKASNVLLTGEDFDTAVNRALQIIGETIDTDRVDVIEYWQSSAQSPLPNWRLLYEWNSPNTVSQMNDSEVKQGNHERIEQWYELLSKGQTLRCQIEEIPEPVRGGQAKIGVKTFYAVPIFVEGNCWGCIGFDDCRIKTNRSEAEISILKTAADCIGTAIQRDRTQKAILEAERERAQELEHLNGELQKTLSILAATTEASNVLLTGEALEPTVNTALQIIGETIKTDRIAIVENFDNPLDPSHLYWKITYEWDSAYAISQIEHQELQQGSYEGIEEWYELWSQGQTISCQLEDMPEPFRSGQAKIGLKTFNSVPIFIEGQYWGNIGIDDCREATNRSEAELNVLKTAAACIGSAIQRDRTQKAILEAEQKRVQSLQTITNLANQLLRSSNYKDVLPEVLAILGEIAQSDRSSLIQNISDSTTGKAAVQIIAEWCHEGISESIESTPELETALLWECFPEFQDKLAQGEISSFLVEELSEPARNMFQAQGNISMTLIPILIQGEFWGVFGFDYCQSERSLEDKDKTIFAIAVDSIAAAIEREQKNEALKQSEKRFRELFEASNDGIHFIEYETPIPINLPIEEQIDRIYSSVRYTDINPAVEKNLNLSRSQVVGKPLTAVHLPDSGHRSLMRQMIENGWQITNIESEDIDRDGNKRYWLSHLFTTIENGYAIRGWGIANNITPLKQAQQALLEAEQERARELKASNQILSLRDKWLEATAKAADRLLATPDLDEGINAALKMLGENLDCDRVSIMKHFEDGIEGYVQTLYEWDSPGTIAQINHPELNKISLQGIKDWISQMKAGDFVGGIVEELPQPFSSQMAELNEKSTYAVPIFMGEVFWGILGIAHCQEAKRLTLPEIAVFKTAASCIGSAIHSQQIQQEKERATQEKAAQLEASNQILSLRDKWLEATAKAADRLLATPDLDEGINAALKMLGENLDCDRVCVARWFEDSTQETFGFIRLLYEWDSVYASRQIIDPEFKEIIYSKDFEDIVIPLKNGEFAGGIIDEIADRSFAEEQIKLGVRSTYVVGIFIDGEFWGVLGVDHCREAKRLTLPEISVFKTAASCIGSAIHSQQIQQEKERATQEKAAQLEASNQILSLRDKWLEATAKAADRLLATPNLDEGINAALKMLGENLDCDRVLIMKHFEDDTGNTLGFVRTLNEWNSPHTISQLAHPVHVDIPWKGIEDWLAREKAGEWIGGVVEELKEPFRTSQAELGVKATYGVPIFMNGNFWGALCIDFCREAKRLTLPEISVFKTAASCLGGAIYSQQIQREKEKAELAIFIERTRIAREIHDTLAQAFGGILMQLQVAEYFFNSKLDKSRSHIKTAQILAQDALTEARNTVWFLHQDDSQYRDLETLIPQVAAHLTANTGVEIEISISEEAYPLPSNLGINLLRIVREAISNTLKHANADLIVIELTFQPQHISLLIQDNGSGFDISQKNLGFGLMGMQQRANNIGGQLVIDSSLGKGTEVSLLVTFD